MSKARTRIKFGPPSEPKTDRSHLETIEPGDEVSANVTDHIDDEKADLYRGSIEDEDFKPAYDPNDPDSYAGEEAARHSKLMAPNHPNRPSTIEGEESWKVAQKGAFGRAGAITEPVNNDPKAAKRRDDQKQAAGKGPTGGQPSPATGAATAATGTQQASDDKGKK